MTEVNVYEFFDSNMTFERAMKYGVKEKASDKRYSEDVSEARFLDKVVDTKAAGPKVTSPWRRQVLDHSIRKRYRVDVFV